MTTKTFDRSYRKAQKRNKMLTFEEKLKIWKHVKRDWGNGENTKQFYSPFPEAELIHKSKARTVVLACGNRFAKSLIAAMEAICLLTQPGTKTWIVGASYAVCDNEWEYIEQAITNTDFWRVFCIKKLKRLLRKQWSADMTKEEIDKKFEKYNFEQHRKIYHDRGNRLIFDWPGENPSVIEQKSYGADWVGMEGAKVSLIIYAEGSKVPSRLRERHLKKRLSDLYGREIIPATPKGRDSFLYPSFHRGLSKELVVDIDWINKTVTTLYKNVDKSEYHVDKAESYSESYETFQFPGYVNPYYNREDYNSDVKDMFSGKLDASIFRERNFGTFESLSGSYFMGVDEDKTFVNSFPLPENITCYRAMDPGRATHACCLWIAVQPWEGNKFRYIVYNELYRANLYLETYVETVKKMTQRDIYMNIIDRQAEYQTFDGQFTWKDRMMDLGIKPLRKAEGMPRGTIARCDLWLPELKDGTVVIFKDRCPNFVDEILQTEYADPKTANGIEVRQEKLAASPQHAIDSFNYFRWSNPKYVPPHEVKALRGGQKKEPAQPMSYAYAMKEETEDDSFYGML